MTDEIDLFSRTQKPENYKNAKDVRNTLIEQNHDQPEQAINTKELFQKGFQFPNVAEYEHVVNLLTEVQTAQENLNNNQDSTIL